MHEVSSGSIANGVIMAGDVLVGAELGGKSIVITRQHHIVDLMLRARVGDTVYVTVERIVEGTPTELTLEFAVTQDCIASY